MKHEIVNFTKILVFSLNKTIDRYLLCLCPLQKRVVMGLRTVRTEYMVTILYSDTDYYSIVIRQHARQRKFASLKEVYVQ